jgi:hypothetical protein
MRQKAREQQYRRRQREAAQQRLPQAARGAAAQSGQQAHQHHHQKVLGNQKTERQAAVQRVDLAFVPQQLDDDDGARKGQRETHYRGGGGRHAECGGQRRAGQRRQQHLCAAGEQRHWSQRAQQARIELQAHQEQQHRHAELAQRLHVHGIGDHTQHVRPGHDAGHDESDDQRLAQPLAEVAQERAQHQQGGGFVEDAVCGSHDPMRRCEPDDQQNPCQVRPAARQRSMPCLPPRRRGSDQNGLTMVRHTTAIRISVGISLKTRK